MAIDTETQLAQVLREPWSREVVADEDGAYVASVPELPGCFADGDTPADALRNLEPVLADWLEDAITQGESLPEPRRLREETYSGRFSVRVPRSLHRLLSERAAREDSSLNQLIAVLLTQAVHERNQRQHRPPDQSDAHEPITADAVRTGAASISAIKGIANFLRKRGDVNLACLLYAVAADRIALAEGGQASGRELGIAAALARREGRFRLAEVLYREGLRRDPTNLRSSSALGQLLYRQGRYAEASEFLQRAAGVDPYAKLYQGWSQLLLGLENDELEREGEGLSGLVDALRGWAYHNGDRADQASWLRHVRRLALLGSRFQPEVQELLTFANANARWGRLSEEQVRSLHDDSDVDSDPAEAT
jgi:predicted RNase H-like HicB family nuclease